MGIKQKLQFELCPLGILCPPYSANKAKYPTFFKAVFFYEAIKYQEKASLCTW